MMSPKNPENQSILSHLPPAKAIVKLAVPATLALLAKAVYNLVDTAYIGITVCQPVKAILMIQNILYQLFIYDVFHRWRTPFSCLYYIDSPAMEKVSNGWKNFAIIQDERQLLLYNKKTA